MTLLLAVCVLASMDGLVQSPFFPEKFLTEDAGNGVRLYLNAPAAMQEDRPSLVVLYFTPNGNSIEETVGRRARDRGEWRYDIQHVGAQIRTLREMRPKERIVLAVAEAEGKSWPAWRSKRPKAGRILLDLVQRTLARFPGAPARLAVCAHSGGGAAIWAMLEAGEVPDAVETIALLDANYSFAAENGHGERLRAWLRGSPGRRLAVAAYDDRNVKLDGKPVVGPAGGTYRATERMTADFAKASLPETRLVRDFDTWTFDSGRAVFWVNRNYANQILHTALVGEMNGLLWALTLGRTEEARWVAFGGPRAYDAFVEPVEKPLASFRRRPHGGASGSALADRLAAMGIEDRERALLREVEAGNFPEFLRCLRKVSWTAKCADGVERRIEIEAAPDVFAVGSDADFLRAPLSLSAAKKLCQTLECELPTPRVVDEIARAAEVRLDPRPLTEAREAWTTFVRHNAIVEEQRRGAPLGPIVVGAKKDLVETSLLRERPDRVAIYGWHRDDGKPIQPLSLAHRAGYVDYSHGVRLIGRRVKVDGVERGYREVIEDAVLRPLLLPPL